MDIQQMNAWQFIIKGGPMMGPILLCSLGALAIFIEKFSYFSSISTDVIGLQNKVFELLKQNKLKDAIVICEQNPSPVAKIMKAGIVKYGSNREDMKLAIEGVGLAQVPRLEKNLQVLSTIAHTALLLGLLGTTIGMIDVFQTIQARSISMSPVTPGDLAGGIGQALFATTFGLCVAIPSFLAYNFCVIRAKDFVVTMERAAVEVVNLLSHLSGSNTP